jgi:uncharacterized protein (TIGR02145 family)
VKVNPFLIYLLVLFSIFSCKKNIENPKFIGSVQDFEGKVYKYTEIKGDYWMIENLNTSCFQNGDSLIEIKSYQEWENAISEQKPAWCYYNFDSLNGIKFGKIYNLFAIKDSRNLAPVGWHISTEGEWYNLENNYFGEWNAGLYLKSNYGWANGGNGNNESYFNALPAGSMETYLHFHGESSSARFWTSTSKSIVENGSALLPSINNLLNIMSSDYDNGLYVRCVKDK